MYVYLCVYIYKWKKNSMDIHLVIIKFQLATNKSNQTLQIAITQ